MLNGLIGEADSLLKAILETLDDSFTKHVKNLTNLGQKIES
jgi:23S rRNA maturation mini-RNase III